MFGAEGWIARSASGRHSSQGAKRSGGWEEHASGPRFAALSGDCGFDNSRMSDGIGRVDPPTWISRWGAYPALTAVLGAALCRSTPPCAIEPNGSDQTWAKTLLELPIRCVEAASADSSVTPRTHLPNPVEAEARDDAEDS